MPGIISLILFSIGLIVYSVYASRQNSKLVKNGFIPNPVKEASKIPEEFFFKWKVSLITERASYYAIQEEMDMAYSRGYFDHENIRYTVVERPKYREGFLALSEEMFLTVSQKHVSLTNVGSGNLNYGNNSTFINGDNNTINNIQNELEVFLSRSDIQ